MLLKNLQLLHSLENLFADSKRRLNKQICAKFQILMLYHAPKYSLITYHYICCYNAGRSWDISEPEVGTHASENCCEASVVKLPYTQSYFDLSQILTYIENVEATLLTEYIELFAWVIDSTRVKCLIYVMVSRVTRFDPIKMHVFLVQKAKHLLRTYRQRCSLRFTISTDFLTK